MTLAMSRERGRPGRIGRSAHYSNSAAIYLIKHPPVRLARASHANARGTDPTPPSKWKWIVVGPTPSALASLRRLNPFAPTLPISLAAAATIAGLVRPARVPAFRFSLTLGLEVFFLGIGHDDARDERGKGAPRANR